MNAIRAKLDKKEEKKFIKAYVSLPDLKKTAKRLDTVVFQDESRTFVVDGRNHILFVGNLERKGDN